MSLRWHSFHLFILCLAAIGLTGQVAAEEPGNGYVVDPEIEKVIAAAIDPDKAIAFPAQKRLVELGGAAERALNFKLFNEKVTQNRRTYADLIARCCTGRVGYRVTLELLPDGSGRLVLESDRTVLAECAQKYDRLNNKPAVVFPADELRRNPYSKVDLAKHIVGSMKYNQGGTLDNNGRIVASGEVGFSSFDDFAAFATSFDKLGYHMLNGISIFDNNNLRTLRFKKNPENERNRALTYLLMFHDVKWEFVLDFKGDIKSHNATRMDGGKFVWQFNCAQMLSGETEIEASFDPFAIAKQSKETPRSDDPAAQNPATPAAAPGTLAAVAANKVVRVAIGKRYDRATMPNPNGPDTIALLDGNPSQPRGPGLRYQWVQTSGIPLDLPADKLTQPAIKMLFYEAGKYTFDLTVSLNGQVSAPTEVTVLVGDVPLDNVADNTQGDPNAERKPVELAPKKKTETANLESRPQATPPIQNIAPVQPTFEEKPESKFVVTPPTIPQPEYKPEFRPETKPVPVSSNTVIALDEIRREEAEYNQRVAARGGATQNPVPNQVPTNPAPIAKNTAPEALPTPPVPPVPQKPEIPQGTLVSKVTADGIELDEIRREEEQFYRVHPEKRAQPVAFKPVQPQKPVPPISTEKPAEKPPVVAQPATKPPVAPKPPEPPPAVASNDKPDTRLDIPQPPPKDKPPVKVVTPEAPKNNVAPKVAENTPKPEAKPAKISDKELEDIKKKLDSINNPKENVAKVSPPPPAVVKKEDPKPVEKPVEKVVVPSIPPGNGGEALKRGLQLLKGGQFSAAVEALKPSAVANPKDETTQMTLAMALFEGAEKPDGYDRAGTQAALDKFNEVIGLNEANAQAFMYVGHCNARLEHDQEKGMYYKKGYSLGKDKVAWEIKWALGNRYLKGREFAAAADVLLIAETSATQAGVSDPRLLRDLAIAFHGTNKNDEAIKRVNALWELGYLPDQKLVAELKTASPAAVKVPDSAYTATPAVAQTPSTPATADAGKPAKTDVKTTDKIAEVPKTKIADSNTNAQVPPASKPGTEAKPETPAVASATAPKPQTLKDLDTLDPTKIPVSPRPNPAVRKVEAPKEPPRVARPLPPVPATFEGALAAGKAAVARGKKLLDDNSQETKDHIQECWDEAEAMLRGAWALKPDDLEVKAQFEDLAQQVGVIALVKSPMLISKPNGLVVLNAEPSIVFPEGKTMYYAWQQVDGKELNIRHEDLDKKMVGLRIKNPGTYKFELVVSDGTRGGNPVTVVVEVR